MPDAQSGLVRDDGIGDSSETFLENLFVIRG